VPQRAMTAERMQAATPLPSLAVAIPAYNEADGIGGFLQEIDRVLSPHAGILRLIVVDDNSTDDTVAVLERTRPLLGAELEIVLRTVNRGHGACLLDAYRRALAVGADYVLQVDGDGQFHGSDLRRVLVLLLDQAHAVCGVRRFRQDPWFRMAMTRLVRAYVALAFGVRARDANCPLRGYEADLLAELLGAIPDPCLIPNLYLTIVASRRGRTLVEVDVSHRVRRGAAAQGSTWRSAARSPVPWRLVRFSLQALRESLALRRALLAPARCRADSTAALNADSV
jgi:dolichol-phosphate mannosyltransferase